ncbi:MAG: YHS domain-containing protein [Chloroflexota bacterium]|jgi:YHS domain-containing protein
MEILETTTQPHDPVCGMTINPEVAQAAGLTAEHEGQSYYFCGRGCKLEFLDDPKRFFDPEYLPHM